MTIGFLVCGDFSRPNTQSDFFSKKEILVGDNRPALELNVLIIKE
jgi:hypothetical protein